MTDQAINEAIAMALPSLRGRDCVNDLNAMFQAEETLIGTSNESIYRHKIETASDFTSFHATARQRAEAFLRALSLWRDDTTERKETK